MPQKVSFIDIYAPATGCVPMTVQCTSSGDAIKEDAFLSSTKVLIQLSDIVNHKSHTSIEKNS
jgi:hypothetical protein